MNYRDNNVNLVHTPAGTPGCTYEDPYNAFIACPWCYYQWLKHSSTAGVCD